jgi:hypothetical protein
MDRNLARATGNHGVRRPRYGLRHRSLWADLLRNLDQRGG